LAEGALSERRKTGYHDRRLIVTRVRWTKRRRKDTREFS
jgi:hypothetical protein